MRIDSSAPPAAARSDSDGAKPRPPPASLRRGRSMAPSARSSSGTWSARGGAGGAGRRPVDIIDLDRYMRGAVRPGHPPKGELSRRNDCERLVVDAGKPAGLAGVGGLGACSSSTRSSDSAGCEPRRDKRYSHDSGLSDGSYVRRRHRDHRRVDAGGGRGGGARASSTTNSMRTFRAVCERALRDQQEQIARVAQICERLAMTRAGGEGGAGGARRAGGAESGGAGAGAPPVSASLDSSELSSSSRSRSTRDPRRMDKLRTEECKTYKIIMSKLDELNRLFATRGRAPGAGPAGAAGGRSSRSASVSVRDKLVATEPAPPAAPPPAPAPAPVQMASQLVERAVGGSRSAHALPPAPPAHPAPAPAAPVPRPPASPSPPRVRRSGRLNVASDSPPSGWSIGEGRGPGAGHAVAQYGSSASSLATPDTLGTIDSARAVCCGFDLDDPVHLYAQAKRLQALHARTAPPRRAGPPARACTPPARGPRPRAAPPSAGAPPRAPSLCAVCRGYWRALRHCLAHQFCRPDSV